MRIWAVEGGDAIRCVGWAYSESGAGASRMCGMAGKRAQAAEGGDRDECVRVRACRKKTTGIEQRAVPYESKPGT